MEINICMFLKFTVNNSTTKKLLNFVYFYLLLLSATIYKFTFYVVFYHIVNGYINR